jgi:hypothetical protein
MWTREVDMRQESADPIERWTGTHHAALVLSILKGEMSVAEDTGNIGLTVAEVGDWQERFLLGAENALSCRPKEEVLEVEQIKNLNQRSAHAEECSRSDFAEARQFLTE